MIWYFDFWLRRCRTPVCSGFVVCDFFLLFVLLAALPVADFVVDGKYRSFKLEKEYGDSGAGMIASQIIASELLGVSLAGDEAG